MGDSKSQRLFDDETDRWLAGLPEAALWLDAGGRVGWLNAVAAGIVPAGEPLGKRLEDWFEGPFFDTEMVRPMNALWWQGGYSKNLLGINGPRWRWFRVTLAPYREGQLCVLTEVTQEHNQALAYHSSLEVFSSLLTQEEHPQGLFERILRTAVEVVPGAEAGSLLLLEEGRFRFMAQIGFDPQVISSTLDYNDELSWYGLGKSNWLSGKPRLLTAPALQQRSRKLGLLESPFGGRGRLEELQATLMIPVVLQGQVLGTFNLDSFSSPESFPPEALAVAQTFALQTATVIYGVWSRRNLSQMALSDALTGLGNRHALEEDFPKLKAQSVRLELPLALVYWDMDGLKKINDQHGHASGDQALKILASALRGGSRQSDSAYRIGGDEFVSLHLNLHEREIPELVQRIRSELHTSVSVGAVMVGPNTTLDKALSQADERMYRDKRRVK